MVSLSLVAPDFGRRCRPAPSRRTRRLARCELAASVLCSNVPGLARRAIRMCGVTPLAEPVAWQNHAEFIGRHAFAAPWPTASDGDAFVWNDNHTSINLRRDAFPFFTELKRELVCFFPVPMALRSPAPQFGLGVEEKKREADETALEINRRARRRVVRARLGCVRGERRRVLPHRCHVPYAKLQL